MSTTPFDTNFKDDILASSNAKRKYQMTYNDDGTVSFQDVTAYSQMGSAFGAKEVNEERAAINKINSDRIVTLDEIDLVTEPGFFVDAMAVKQLNRKLPFCGRGKGTVTSNEANSLNIPVTFPTAMNNTDYVVCANLVTGSIGAFDKNYDVEVIVTKKSLTGCTLSIMRGTFGFLDYGAVLSVEYIVLPS